MNYAVEDSDWERFKRIAQRAFELEGTQRSNYLDTECGQDAALRSNVESLLAAGAAQRSDFLEPPIQMNFMTGLHCVRSEN